MVNITRLVKTFPFKAALAPKVFLYCLPSYSKRVRELLFDAVPSSASSFDVGSLSAENITISLLLVWDF